MFLKLRKNAQTTAEYAIVIALVIGAVVAMQVYVKRGLQGRIKDVVDHRGSGGNIGDTEFNYKTSQYEPYYMVSNANTYQSGNELVTTMEGGSSNKFATSNVEVYRNQNQSWNGYENENPNP